MTDANHLTRFLYQDGQVDFTAPIPVDFLAFEIPDNHNPETRPGHFRLAPNWIVRWNEHDQDISGPPEGFQLYNETKEISILSPWEEPHTLWEIFRRGDMIFRLENYPMVKHCVRIRHAAPIPPWGTFERFVRLYCPWCLPPDAKC